jgi:hypothetical protein
MHHSTWKNFPKKSLSSSPMLQAFPRTFDQSVKNVKKNNVGSQLAGSGGISLGDSRYISFSRDIAGHLP